QPPQKHPPLPRPVPATERRRPSGHALHGPRLLSMSPRLMGVVSMVGLLGIALGVFGLFLGRSHDIAGMLAIMSVGGVGQALALERDNGSSSGSAAGGRP